MIDKDKLINLIIEIFGKTNLPISNNDIIIINRSNKFDNGHCRPKKLPSGYNAVYMFFYQDKALKIGKANEKSNARYTSHHYNCHAPSTLVKSILKDKNWGKDFNFEFEDRNPENIGNWILNNTRRIDIEIKATYGKHATSLIESILHYLYNPRYEG